MSEINVTEFLENIVKTIVDNPEDVSVVRSLDEKGVLFELSVNNADLGRVIGKKGDNAQAIRTILRALGVRNDARYSLKIIDPQASATEGTSDGQAA